MKIDVYLEGDHTKIRKMTDGQYYLDTYKVIRTTISDIIPIPPQTTPANTISVTLDITDLVNDLYTPDVLSILLSTENVTLHLSSTAKPLDKSPIV